MQNIKNICDYLRGTKTKIDSLPFQRCLNHTFNHKTEKR